MDDQMVEDVAHAIAPRSFDPKRVWSALIGQTAEQAREVQQNHVRGLARDALKAAGVDDLRAALDAAQDEIERCIADREALREQVEDLRRRLADPESHRTTWQGIGGAS